MVLRGAPARERRSSTARSAALDPASWSIGLLGRRSKLYLLAGAQVAADLVIVTLAFALAYVMHSGWPPSMEVSDWKFFHVWALAPQVLTSGEFRVYMPLLAIGLVLFPASLVFFHGYSTITADLRPFGRARANTKAAVTAALLLGFVAFAAGASRYSSMEGAPHFFALYFVYLALLLLFGSLLAHSAILIGLLYLQCIGMGRIRSAAVADDETAGEIAKILSAPTSAHFYVGTISVDGDDAGGGDRKLLGNVRDLEELINHYNLSQVILAVDPGELSAADRLTIAETCWRMGAQLKMVAPFHPYFRTETRTEHFGGLSLLHVERAGLYARPSQLAKRCIDIAVSLFGLLVTSPILLATAVAIKIDSPGPVLFKQQRVGLGGRRFNVWKFRSMRQDADPKLHAEFLTKVIEQGQEDLKGKSATVSKIPNDPRITRVGKLIRLTSIDELPQFFNVLRGEMSLVGPRPELPYAVELYSDYHRRRLGIRPGMTGLWQVSGRSRLTYDQMFELDIRYAEEWSLWLDLWIIAMTVPVLLKMGDTS